MVGGRASDAACSGRPSLSVTTRRSAGPVMVMTPPMMQPVVIRADQHEVEQLGRTAVLPVHDVVGVQAAGGPAAGHHNSRGRGAPGHGAVAGTFVRAREVEDITYKQAFQIGLFQCLSLWPGFSRAGATIAGGLLAGASLRAAADFSFLIAVPVIFVAGGYDLYKSWHLFGVEDLPFMLTGFIVSFVVAMLAVVSFLKLLQKLKLSAFAYYRFVLAALFWIYMSTVGLG